MHNMTNSPDEMIAYVDMDGVLVDISNHLIGILSHRKDLNRGALLIDDRPNNGAKEFGEIEGQRWIHFGSEAFPDWHAVLAELDC